MRYKNGGPNSLYVIVDLVCGNVQYTSTNKRNARAWHSRRDRPKDYVLLTYDQRKNPS